MLKVSIIISNFNYGSFLAASIESALNQTYSPLEVLVVDDGSTDSSLDVMSAFEDRVKVFRRPHIGETATRNFGFLNSTGDLVCFLDSDDYLRADAVSTVVKHWRPEFSKLQFHLRVVDQSGTDQRLQMPRCPLDSGRVERLLLETGRYITSPGSGNFYARWFLERIMPAPVEEWPQSFDSYAATHAAFNGEIGAIQTPLAFYRVHRNNTSRAIEEGSPELQQIEKLLGRSLRLKRLIQEIAQHRGLEVNPNIVTSHWLHLKLQLAQQKLVANSSQRTLFETVRRIIRSAVIAPELSIVRRCQLIAWAFSTALLPRNAAGSAVRLGFDLAPENRLARSMRRL